MWNCPFHDDHTPSFAIKRDEPFSKFKCRGCGKWGDENDLLRNEGGIYSDYGNRQYALKKWEEEYKLLRGDKAMPTDKRNHRRQQWLKFLTGLTAYGNASENFDRQFMFKSHERQCKKPECVMCSVPERGLADLTEEEYGDYLLDVAHQANRNMDKVIDDSGKIRGKQYAQQLREEPAMAH
jgi:CHC2 zinc finger